uniref:Uncharacterized protein n=1 Tax=Varanus komodoensis TaxID=61221 RepID=A0A8D2LXH8_VARKO
ESAHPTTPRQDGWEAWRGLCGRELRRSLAGAGEHSWIAGWPRAAWRGGWGWPRSGAARALLPPPVLRLAGAAGRSSAPTCAGCRRRLSPPHLPARRTTAPMGFPPDALSEQGATRVGSPASA